MEKGITYFVYIKFYIDNKNNIKPLVVDESANLTINSSVCDLSFSHYNDTKNSNVASRKFLLDENLNYFYEKNISNSNKF